MQAVRLREYLLTLDPDPNFSEEDEEDWLDAWNTALNTTQELMLDLYDEAESLYILKQLRNNFGVTAPERERPELQILQGGRK